MQFRKAIIVGCLVSVALSPGASHAQEVNLRTGRIIGQVLEAGTDRPVENVAVRIPALDRPVQLTRADGRFALDDIPAGIHELELTSIGYRASRQTVNVPLGELVIVTVRLGTEAVPLDSLTVTVRRRRSLLDEVGFVRRERRGSGHFFIDDDVTGWQLEHSLLAVPGITIRHRGAISVVQMRSLQGGDCVPAIYLDGVRQRVVDGDMREVVSGLDLAGMEVYRGNATPPEFRPPFERPCGAIVLWRRKQ